MGMKIIPALIVHALDRIEDFNVPIMLQELAEIEANRPDAVAIEEPELHPEVAVELEDLHPIPYGADELLVPRRIGLQPMAKTVVNPGCA